MSSAENAYSVVSVKCNLTVGRHWGNMLLLVKTMVLNIRPPYHVTVFILRFEHNHFTTCWYVLHLATSVYPDQMLSFAVSDLDVYVLGTKFHISPYTYVKSKLNFKDWDLQKKFLRFPVCYFAKHKLCMLKLSNDVTTCIMLVIIFAWCTCSLVPSLVGNAVARLIYQLN